MNDPHKSDPAAPRFFALALTRFAGMFLAIFGIIITAGNSDLPVWLGYVLALAGLVSFFYVPKMLAKRWRSPPE